MRITDADILKYGRSLRDGTATDAIGRHACIVALGLGSPCEQADDQIAQARDFLADVISDRRAMAKP